MRSTRLTLCTGLMLATALTPTAYAADGGGGIAVTPSSPAPGTDIALRVSDCTARTATAVSAAFVAETRLTGTDGTLIGETRIRTSLKAGSYGVTVSCGGTDRKAALTVVEGSPRSDTHRPTTPASPVAPVHAGGGGSAHLADVDTAVNAAEDARAAGPGRGHAVIGLILAAAAAVAVVLRSARRSTRRSRRTD
ncbi:hypothetical protein ACFYO2_18780 [Streptomyces sp. NPDC006602]|uniref:hypothetical protein n=1 Tax=Streptomyces sp. NPDC006602 TaxID=3364751 RepID=UPI0036BFFF4E